MSGPFIKNKCYQRLYFVFYAWYPLISYWPHFWLPWFLAWSMEQYSMVTVNKWSLIQFMQLQDLLLPKQDNGLEWSTSEIFSLFFTLLLWTMKLCGVLACPQLFKMYFVITVVNLIFRYGAFMCIDFLSTKLKQRIVLEAHQVWIVYRNTLMFQTSQEQFLLVVFSSRTRKPFVCTGFYCIWQ